MTHRCNRMGLVGRLPSNLGKLGDHVYLGPTHNLRDTQQKLLDLTGMDATEDSKSDMV